MLFRGELGCEVSVDEREVDKVFDRCWALMGIYYPFNGADDEDSLDSGKK